MAKKTKQNSTQGFVPVRDIKDNVVILKNGQLSMVLLVSSVNFALKSLDEQEAILHQFQSFLNTIDFSLQFYIQSRRLDIEPYMKQLQDRESLQDNDLMKVQLNEYMQFIRTFTKEVDVMSKNFFVVIPYTPVSANIQGSLSQLFGGSQKINYDESSFKEHRMQLEQRVALVEQGLSRVNVRSVLLKNDELVELYYHIFNPTDPSGEAPQQKPE